MKVQPQVVVGAAILDGARLLAAQRRTPSALAGKWELPGGKVEPAESDEEALVRECREELGVDVMLGRRVGRDWPIGEYGVLRVWLAAITDGEPACREHAQLRWLTVDDLHDVHWLPADLPIVEKLAELMLDTSHHEVRLRGGNVGGAIRVGATVRRPTGSWTPAVHALLRHLEAAGLDAIPHVVGVDDEGREVLGYVFGDTADAHDGWPDWVWADTLLVQAARWLRRYHDAVAGFPAEQITRWRFFDKPLADGEIICHYDVAPYNVVVGFDAVGEPVLRCVIDWDIAGPGKPLHDVAMMAWQFLPCWEPGDDAKFIRRLRLLADNYGASPFDILEALEPSARFAIDTVRMHADSDPGMRRLVDGGYAERNEQAVAAFAARLPRLRALARFT